MSKSQDQDEISQLEKSPPLPSPDFTNSFLVADTTTRRSGLQTVNYILSTDSVHHPYPLHHHLLPRLLYNLGSRRARHSYRGAPQ